MDIESFEKNELEINTDRNSEIDFYKLECRNFPESFEIDKVYLREPDHDYLTNQIVQEVDLNKSDTTVLNIGVGQGKSTAIYRIAQNYMDREDTIVILASPYKSLVDKDYEYLKNEFSSETVLHYRDLDNDEVTVDVSQFKAHVITINSLMGNPGNELYQQKAQKQSYLKKLRDYLKESKKKAVIFFDEIHDSIQNFDEKYILNLRLWKPVIHKVFISSATFTPASVIATSHLAYLTSTNGNSKLKILESIRSYKQSGADLHLHIGDVSTSGYENFYEALITNLLKRYSSESASINVLTNYKSIAKKIVSAENKELGKVITKSNLTLITGDEDEKFIEKGLNIGTSFYTGINIKNDTSVLIILVGNFLGDQRVIDQYGIFAAGSDAIVQALARMRSKGDIHVIMPKPTSLIQDLNNTHLNSHITLSFKEQRRNFNEKWEILKKEYKNRTVHLESVIKHAKNETAETIINDIDRPVTLFPDFYSFAMNSGDSYLTTSYLSYGKDISPFIIWASYNHQFQNCRLKETNLYEVSKKLIELDDDIEANVKVLSEILSDQIKIEIRNLLQDDGNTDSEALKLLHESLTGRISDAGRVVKPVYQVKGTKKNKSQLLKSRPFLQSYLSLLFYLKYGCFRSYANVEVYLLDNTAAVEGQPMGTGKIIAYKRLRAFRGGILVGKFMGHTKFIEQSGFTYFELQELNSIAEVLNKEDFFIKNAYSFFTQLDPTDSFKTRKHVIKQMRELFIVEKRRPVIKGERKTLYLLQGRRTLPNQFLDLHDFDGFK